jgi:hypothetical protein
MPGEDITVGAVFKKKTEKFTPKKEVPGSVVCPEGKYEVGDKITLTAVPDEPGYKFLGWAGDIESSMVVFFFLQI